MSADGGRGPDADDGEVDPRFDPRFQRGYDPARHPARGGSGGGAERSRSARPVPDADRVPGDDSATVRPIPAQEEDRPSDDPAVAPDEEVDELEPDDDERPERGSSRVWLVGLAAVSAIATVAGAIGVLTLLSEPPLQLTLAAETVPVSLRIALELISGPVLAAGLVGVAVTLVLLFAGRRDRR